MPRRNLLLKFSFLLAINVLLASVSFAQTGDAGDFGSGGSANYGGSSSDATDTLGTVGNGSQNIGDRIISWIMMGASYSNPQSTLFGALSMILNSVMLAFALACLGKHSLQYITLTASKGAPGGAKIAGGIVAVRSSLAIMMLSPIVANGFSPIQVAMREFAEFGAYIGDQSVKVASDYLTGQSGEGSGTVIPAKNINGVSAVVWQAAVMETCVAALQAYYTHDQTINPEIQIKPELTVDVGVMQAQKDSAGNEVKNFVASGSGQYVRYERVVNVSGAAAEDDNKSHSCGSIVLNLTEQLKGRVSSADGSTELTFRAQKETFLKKNDPLLDLRENTISKHHDQIKKILEDFQGISKNILSDQALLTETSALRASGMLSVDQVEQLYTKYNTKLKQTKQAIPAYGQQVMAIHNTYEKAIRNHGAYVSKYVYENNAIKGETDGGTLTWSEELNKYGFASLGSYYWSILKTALLVNKLQAHLAEPGTAPYPLNFSAVPAHSFTRHALFETTIERLADLKAYYASNMGEVGSIDQLVFVTTSRTGEMDAKGPDQISLHFIRELVNTLPRLIMEGVGKFFSGITSGDIIVNLMSMGILINGILESLLFVAIAAWILGGAAKFLPIGKLAAKATAVVPGLSGFPDGIVSAVKTLFPLLIMFVAAGIILQYILPTIPLIKWVVSLQSWAIMLFMAMIYGPALMMSTTAASTEEWIDQNTKDLFLLFAELILRPLLMVVGFFAAIWVMQVADIAARMLFPYLIGLGTEGIFGLIGMVAVVLISTYGVYQLILRTFDLIHEVPDSVFERLGGKPLGDVAKDQTGNNMAALVVSNRSEAMRALGAGGGLGDGGQDDQAKGGKGESDASGSGATKSKNNTRV